MIIFLFKEFQMKSRNNVSNMYIELILNPPQSKVSCKIGSTETSEVVLRCIVSRRLYPLVLEEIHITWIIHLKLKA